MEQSEMREAMWRLSASSPHCAALHAGYEARFSGKPYVKSNTALGEHHGYIIMSDASSEMGFERGQNVVKKFIRW